MRVAQPSLILPALSFAWASCGPQEHATNDDVPGADGMSPSKPSTDSGSGLDRSSPAQDAGAPAAPGITIVSPGAPKVAISEIMYAPVLDEGPVERHEFIELYNTTAADIPVAGWKLEIDGVAAFTFPANTVLKPKSYVVVARSKEDLAKVTKYALAASALLGNTTVDLDNGGATIRLVDAAGEVVDALRYDDKAPWPIGADSFGAGEAWFPKNDPRVPFKNHQHRGRSLERYSFDHAASEPANWEASPIDGATPGKANTKAGDPPTIALSVSAAPKDNLAAKVIRAKQPLLITARMSDAKLAGVVVEYQSDPAHYPDTPRTLARAGMTAADRTYTAELPGQSENTLIRYRIRAGRAGTDDRVISPRPSDPFEWHALFVTPEIATRSAVYHLFISPANWTAIWKNAVAGPNSGCTMNPKFDEEVPAVFVADGRPYDVRVRHQGSTFNRRKGNPFKKWPPFTGYPGPTVTQLQDPKTGEIIPISALSWHIKFPKYDRLAVAGKDKKSIVLNKMRQSCPGPLNMLESKLLWAAGVPTQKVGFARLHVNGAYYQYMMQVENPNEDVMASWENRRGTTGDLFKSNGNAEAQPQGLFGLGNWEPIGEACGFKAADRYMATYERQTNDWKDRDPTQQAHIQKLIEQFRVSNGSSMTNLRAYYDKHFDVDHMITMNVIRNWAGVWDDGVHNFYVYRRLEEGKHMMLPQDFDLDWGGNPNDPGFDRNFAQRSTDTFYLGVLAGNYFPAGKVNFLKSRLIWAYQGKFDARLQELSKSLLSLDNIMKVLDESLAEFSLEDWNSSPTTNNTCNFNERLDYARRWIRERAAYLPRWFTLPPESRWQATTRPGGTLPAAR
jgi:hypothetical protein